MSDWDRFNRTLQVQRAHHALNPPCVNARIQQLEAEFGAVPQALKAILAEFDGAELFIAPAGGGPLLTIFPATRRGKGPAYVEGVDHHTRQWRSTRPFSSEWVVGCFNYGGYLVLDAQERIREWDSAAQHWNGEAADCVNLIERVLEEGPAHLAED